MYINIHIYICFLYVCEYGSRDAAYVAAMLGENGILRVVQVRS
jgi:hypothetical protein